MEKFMFIFHGGDKTHMSPEELQGNLGKWMGWIDKLKKTNQYLAGEPLKKGGKLISGKGKTVTDGPYTEGKEVVGGFFMITAKGYDEAVMIAKDFPDFDCGGSVQVRELLQLH